MSETSGPFAVPDFSQVESDEDGFDDEAELDDVDDGDDVEDGDDGDDEASQQADVAPPVTATAPVDGGTAEAVLEHIAWSIVDEPDAVSVDTSSQGANLRLDLHVAPSDMGRIIGRRGRVAEALRSVVRAAAAKDGTDAAVDIVD